MPTAYTAPKLPAPRASALEQGFFDFLVPYKGPLIRPDQAAAAMNRSRKFIYGLIENGDLEIHGVPGRDVERYQITKRSVLLYLAHSANYDPESLVDRLVEIAATLTPRQFAGFISAASARRTKV